MQKKIRASESQALKNVVSNTYLPERERTNWRSAGCSTATSAFFRRFSSCAGENGKEHQPAPLVGHISSGASFFAAVGLRVVFVDLVPMSLSL